ncbi:MAG: AFG1 family ATPase [Alphaproteobacteria bacterium]|nr:AFG1 family ATPase [Alphaproteobacteria bacterium]
MAVLSEYCRRREAGDIRYDPAQEQAALLLQGLYTDLIHVKKSRFFKKPMPKGIYLYGGVGRGKSMLMDMFYEAVQPIISARRVHFHAFMIETHDWLHQHRQEKLSDLMPRYAAEVAKHVSVICFDEFHVTDVADAMILSRLFSALMDKGVVMVSTSNWPPEKLYEGGLQRDLFLPFIGLITSRMTVFHLDHGIDYRRANESGLSSERHYFYPLGAAAKKWATEKFFVFSHGILPAVKTLRVKGRDINITFAGKVARLNFSDICERPHSAEDYLEIARHFDYFIFEGIPKMGYDRRNETKRLMLFIDVMYDQKKIVMMTADAPPEKLYLGHDYTFEFDRTVSRLKEMAKGGLV